MSCYTKKIVNKLTKVDCALKNFLQGKVQESFLLSSCNDLMRLGKYAGFWVNNYEILIKSFCCCQYGFSGNSSFIRGSMVKGVLLWRFSFVYDELWQCSEILISRCDSEYFSYRREETFNTFPTKLNPRTVVHNWWA